MDQRELIQVIGGSTISDDEVAVFPAARIEVDGLDEDQIVLTVHFYRNPEAFDREETHFLKFLVPINGALGLSQMLTSTVAGLRNKPSGS